MKTLLIILTILISSNIAIAGEAFFIKPVSPDLSLTNTTIQNGSTPYLPRKSTNINEHLLINFRGLRKEVIEERRTQEINFIEELEEELIEIRTLQVCA